MKKMLLLVLIFSIMVCSIPTALALDFSMYSDEELLSIIQELNSELIARGIEKTAEIIPGSYLVGRDIPAGKYVLTNLADDTAYYLIYQDNLQNYKDSEALDRGNIYAKNETYIVLEDGQVLSTRHQTLNLTISAGVSFK